MTTLNDYSEEGSHTKYFDCIIICNDIEYKCHRFIICKYTHFEKCLDEKYKINKNEDGKIVLRFNECFDMVINILINYLYNPNILKSVLNNNNIFIMFKIFKYINITTNFLCSELIYLIPNDDIINDLIIEKYESDFKNLSTYNLMHIYNKKYVISYQYIILIIILYNKIGCSIFDEIQIDYIEIIDIEKLRSYYYINKNHKYRELYQYMLIEKCKILMLIHEMTEFDDDNERIDSLEFIVKLITE
uniref:BTB/POZ domain protein n=1 Tax=Pithovirus LCPAC102 TaxID=2506587 RepID=A0A481Z329_9VIRU|nr:MAG: hypothetical protein LCPAC102_00860 [Pithovirus LCPAC102]